MSTKSKVYYKLVHPSGSFCDTTRVYIDKEVNDDKEEILTFELAKKALLNDYILLQTKRACFPFPTPQDRAKSQTYWARIASEMKIVKVIEITEEIPYTIPSNARLYDPEIYLPGVPGQTDRWVHDEQPTETYVPGQCGPKLGFIDRIKNLGNKDNDVIVGNKGHKQ